MKKSLIEIREGVVDSRVYSLTPIQKEVALYKSFYNFMDEIVKGDCDADILFSSLFGIVTFYTSLNLKSVDNSFNFVKNFYESFLIYDLDTSIVSLFDPESLFYDSSLEHKIGASLAIYDMTFEVGDHKEVFKKILESLQSS